MPKLCLIEGCGGTVRAKGYCHKHGVRLRRHGSPHIVKLMRNAPIFDRIMSKVVVDEKTGCWNFTGRSNKFGYGLIGNGGKGGKTIRVHRAIYEHFKGKIPDGLSVCHSCDNRRCCNPEHLWVGTRADNNKDMDTKGRSNRVSGSKIATSKFTEKNVLQIRKEYDKRKGSCYRFCQQYSKKYGVGIYTIRDIVKRRTWRHI